MNEEQLKAIEERREKADIMSLTNAVHDSDACTHADYTFVEWAPDDIAALIAEVRRLQADNADLRRQVADLEELLRREEARG